MKRFSYLRFSLRFSLLVVLMALSSSAHAGRSFSFVVGRHRVHIEAPRHCHSRSCISVSTESRETRRGRYDIDAAPAAAVPAKPPAPAPDAVSREPTVPPAVKPSIDRVASAPAPHVELAAAATREVAAPAAPTIQPSRLPPAPPVPLSSQASTDAARPAPAAASRISRVAREVDETAAETPLGDWQTEGNKGSVRIEQCGRALCGYILSPSSNAVGETVLSNMKPKAASQWSGNIFSRDSGNTYYATMAIKDPNTLRVEACAVGRFFCTGNVWSRIGAPPQKLVTDRQISSAPRS
jgi:uncharacterized protein (DUF2147 family)